MPVEIRIFLGILQDSELKMHLRQSKLWKDDQLLPIKHLLETEAKGKQYVGVYVPSLIPCPELKKTEEQIKSQLHIYCPKLNVDHLKVYLFTQVFVS